MELAGVEEAVTLNVDHNVLDVGVPGPAVLLQDAHPARPQLTHTQLGDSFLRVNLARNVDKC